MQCLRCDRSIVGERRIKQDFDEGLLAVDCPFLWSIHHRGVLYYPLSLQYCNRYGFHDVSGHPLYDAFAHSVGRGKATPHMVHCRNLSMLIFLGQRLFLSAIPGVLPDRVSEYIRAWPETCIYLFFVVVVLCFSIMVERLSAKYRFLKMLW